VLSSPDSGLESRYAGGHIRAETDSVMGSCSGTNRGQDKPECVSLPDSESVEGDIEILNEVVNVGKPDIPVTGGKPFDNWKLPPPHLLQNHFRDIRSRPYKPYRMYDSSEKGV